jgi:hypothetical protein
MSQHEFSPQENTREVWDAALSALQAAKDDERPRLFGDRITTLPPDSKNPEQIVLQADHDGPWRDVRRTLALTALTPVSFRYEASYWDEPDEDIDKSYEPDASETLEWLRILANNIRRQKTTE